MATPLISPPRSDKAVYPGMKRTQGAETDAYILARAKKTVVASLCCIITISHKVLSSLFIIMENLSYCFFFPPLLFFMFPQLLLLLFPLHMRINYSDVIKRKEKLLRRRLDRRYGAATVNNGGGGGEEN